MGDVSLVGDAAVAKVAGRQHRAVSLEQLHAAGLTRNAIAYRLRQGRMRRLWRGVFLVGPGQPDLLALAMAAVLTTKGKGALSHAWACWLDGFGETPSLPVDVTVPGGCQRTRRGITVHRTAGLEPADITRRKRIPVTSPARTLLDYAEVVDRGELERAVAEAQVKHLVSERQLRELIARSPGRRGVAALKAVLDEGPRFTRAESERRMLALVRAADLPRPETNVKVLGGRYEVDFLWRDARLVVEVDGYATHGHRRAFENDRRRQQRLAAAGLAVIPITWRQLTEEAIAVAARVAAALALSAAA